MKHSLEAEGFGVHLRPVRLEDAAFIVWLRNLSHAKGRVGDSAPDVANQEAWLKSYFEREGDYYFIIETVSRIPVGAYGIYNLEGTSAESGRWIIRADVPAAIPSAILAFELAFKRLGLRELRAATVSTNRSVLSLNLKFGFRQTGVEVAAQTIGGKPVDLVQFLLSQEDWFNRHDALLPLARLAAAQICEWEKSQVGSRSLREPGKEA
jgi:RimJ/RimL family protein N-acetyltransferase